jgi:nicotinic acid mononucleotide adenylyltransferase
LSGGNAPCWRPIASNETLPESAAAILARRVRMPAVGIRATDIRAVIAGGGSFRYRTPRAVERYIATHGLYR